MSVLVDTHCWLWYAAEPERLSAAARRRLQSAEEQLWLSAASAWEIAIKFSRGKLKLPEPPATYISTRLQITRATPLAITHDHAVRAGTLPPHHHDPFDRLLIAQGQLEGLPIMTADPLFKFYDVELIDA